MSQKRKRWVFIRRLGFRLVAFLAFVAVPGQSANDEHDHDAEENDFTGKTAYPVDPVPQLHERSSQLLHGYVLPNGASGWVRNNLLKYSSRLANLPAKNKAAGSTGLCADTK